MARDNLKKLIHETCGGDLSMIKMTYMGLSETPALREFNPYLDLEELITFAAASWIKREKIKPHYDAIVDESSLYQLFSWTFQNGGAGMLRNRKNLSTESEQYARDSFMNPYHGDLLEKRLRLVPEEYEVALREQLHEDTHTWTDTTYGYEHVKQLRDGNNYHLHILPYTANHRRSTPNIREKKAHTLSKELSKMISAYPIDMHYE